MPAIPKEKPSSGTDPAAQPIGRSGVLDIYRAHGVILESVDGSESQAFGDCPLCGREGKFYVNMSTGLWDCKRCAEKGNALVFLRKLWDLFDKSTTDYNELVQQKSILFPETPGLWGAIHSPLTNHWYLPGYNVDGKIAQLYKYSRLKDSDGKWSSKLLPTPGLKGDPDLMRTGENEAHALFGMSLYNPRRPDIYVCEGPWDGMVLWELMRSLKPSDTGLVQTGAELASLLGRASVIAVPGCNLFKDSWLPLFKGKRVFLLFDSDHPLPNKATGTITPPGGYEGMRRIAAKLASTTEFAPAEVNYLNWGPEGYDLSLPHGYDIRDMLTKGPLGTLKTIKERASALAELLAKLEPIPTSWVAGRAKSAPAGGVEIEPMECESWKALTDSARRAYKLTNAMERTFSVMMAAVVSTPTQEDQLWVKVIGPPSSGKSELCEALAVNKKYIISKSTIRGFHSGFKTDPDGEEDHSLAKAAEGKTLVIKDGDTLLQSPNLGQILAEGRDLYDRASRTGYRNGINREIENHSMTWILCGTESLRDLDATELGERFLDCQICDEMDEDLEREIAMRRARQVAKGVAVLGNGNGKKHIDLDSLKVKVKQLTAGYINYLRDNAQTLFDGVEVSDEALEVCVTFAEFVSFVRARPSPKQERKAQRELCFRLTAQLTKLAKSLAVVLNKTSVDDEVLRRVRAVAFDTARGKTFDILKQMAVAGREGKLVPALSALVGETETNLRTYLRFLAKIKVAEFYHKQVGNVRNQPRWRMTDRLQRIYIRVMESA